MALNSQGKCHSPQCRYINMMRHENALEVSTFPLTEEEEKVKIEFEGDEKLETSYKVDSYSGSFSKELFLAKIKEN